MKALTKQRPLSTASRPGGQTGYLDCLTMDESIAQAKAAIVAIIGLMDLTTYEVRPLRFLVTTERSVGGVR